MENNTLTSKITQVYSKVVDTFKNKKMVSHFKKRGQAGVKRIKEVGIKEAFLTMGTPSEIEKLTYQEIVKKEKNALQETHKVKKPTSNTSTKETHKKVNTQKTTAKKTTNPKSPNEEKTKKPMVKKTNTKTKKETKTTKKPTASKSKREEKIAHYAKDITKHYGKVDETFLTLIVKNLGPSIYRTNAELVSCSDPKELATVRRNFLINKLGLDASKEVLDAAIEDVCKELKEAKQKYRATFYYALAKKFKKESALS